MFNEEMFKFAVAKKGLKMKEVAEHLGISTVTLYRKMSGESDFYREEIQRCRDLLGKEHINDIFFADKVS